MFYDLLKSSCRNLWLEFWKIILDRKMTYSKSHLIVKMLQYQNSNASKRSISLQRDRSDAKPQKWTVNGKYYKQCSLWWSYMVVSSFPPGFLKILLCKLDHVTAQKMKFSIKDISSKCNQIAGDCRFCHIYWRDP